MSEKKLYFQSENGVEELKINLNSEIIQGDEDGIDEMEVLYRFAELKIKN